MKNCITCTCVIKQVILVHVNIKHTSKIRYAWNIKNISVLSSNKKNLNYIEFNKMYRSFISSEFDFLLKLFSPLCNSISWHFIVKGGGWNSRHQTTPTLHFLYPIKMSTHRKLLHGAWITNAPCYFQLTKTERQFLIAWRILLYHFHRDGSSIDIKQVSVYSSVYSGWSCVYH